MPDIYDRLKYIISFFAATLSISGCNIINPRESVPTYIHIDSFKFDGNKLHDIKCVTIYYNGDEIGTFDLPATIPVIATGATGKLQMAPGILVNGRNERPLTYPFYRTDMITLPEQPGKVIYYIPSTGYYDSVKFKTISDFDNNLTNFSRWGGTTNIIATTDPALKYEGPASGMVYLASAADSSIDSTTKAFVITPGVAFIEFDYKTTAPFAVAMQANLGTLYSSSVNYLAGVLPNDHWQKFYVNVTGFISEYPADTYNMYIKAALRGQTEGRLLIDNIKLVTF